MSKTLLKSKTLAEKIIDELMLNRINCQLSVYVYTEPYFSTCEFLLNVDLDDLDLESFRVLDRLCKKVDVAKVIKMRYLIDLSKGLDDEQLPSQFLLIFIQTIGIIALLKNDYKFLNTMLKLRDFSQFNLCESGLDCISKVKSEMMSGDESL